MGTISSDFWNAWNTEFREADRGAICDRQSEIVTGWLKGSHDLTILDVGCGTGWMSERLTQFGSVVGTDLADEVLERASERNPEIRFVAGDVMTVDIAGEFDVVVTLEVLSHVADQPRFLARLRHWLKPGGQLVLATQNRPVLARFNRIPPPAPGQLRRWVDRKELRRLATEAGFRVDEIRTITPVADHGIMRILAGVGRRTHTSVLLERLGFGWTIMMRATAI